MIIDTHCHLDDARYNDDFDAMLARAKAKGVERFIIPGADPKTLQRAVALSEVHKEVYFSAGVHPYDAQNYNKETVKQHLSHPKCVAVGECGLDYFRLPENPSDVESYKALQKEVFVDQIELAKAHELPLIVHIRDASSDSLALLEAHAGAKGGVLHCYNADEQLLKLSKTFYYGIGGVLTFKNAKKLVNVFNKIPHNRLLIETDAPYLTPHPHRGERNEPAYCELVAQKMGEIGEVAVETLVAQTEKNTTRLFGAL